MDKNKSLMAVKDAVENGEFHDNIDVAVSNYEQIYIYKNVYVNVYYNAPYMQMNIDIDWDDDDTKPAYKSIGLHAGYNTNFQDFSCKDGCLSWDDGDNRISINFK